MPLSGRRPWEDEVDLSPAARGAVLGFTVAAAVGPIALLVIRRTLAAGWAMGIASGLGVALADGLYGAVAAFGLTAVSAPLVAIADPLALVGGAILVWLGVRTALAPAPAVVAPAATSRRGLAGATLSTLALTLANPMTILLFAALVVNLDMGGTTSEALALSIGFFLGSIGWWGLLVASVATLRGRISAGLLRAVTVGSGLLIAAFGAASVAAAAGLT